MWERIFWGKPTCLPVCVRRMRETPYKDPDKERQESRDIVSHIIERQAVDTVVHKRHDNRLKTGQRVFPHRFTEYSTSSERPVTKICRLIHDEMQCSVGEFNLAIDAITVTVMF